MPQGVKQIGWLAFCDAASLTEVTLPEGVEDIGLMSFSGCTSLTSCAFHFDWSRPEYEDFILPADLTAIEAEAFSGLGAEALHIVVPEGCLSIGDGAFTNAAERLKVDIPGYNTAIAENAFSGCDEMQLTCLRGSAADTWASGKAWVTVSYIGE